MYEEVTLTPSLDRNFALLRARLNAPDNADVLLRRFRSGAFESMLLAIDGMCDAKEIDEQILKPCMDLPHTAGEDVSPDQRAAFLMHNAVSILPMTFKDNVDEIIADALSGQSVLMCEGCTAACVMDTRGFEKRTVGRPEAERVVLGPHESFSESIRTNITLLRRIVQREELVTEFISVGGKMKTRCALLYLRGTASEALLARLRRRLQRIDYDFAMTTGEVEQLIEDHPLSLIPQCVRTERPDRAASFLAEGQIVVLTDGSPSALGTPSTLWHQLHTPDDTSMRWQYGTFLRIVRMIGVAVHVLLPGLYLAVLRFHQELFSPMLLTSVYETSSRVPIPVFLEALLMTLAFDLISEAGLRAPGSMGNALGIVSGLILGQSAVSADIVSPLLLIVVAASGLGGFCVPDYALSIGLKIVQLIVLIAGASGGLYMILLVLLALLCALCRMQSLGSPLTAPVTPPRRANPDLLIRLPLRLQKAKSFFARQAQPASGQVCAPQAGRLFKFFSRIAKRAPSEASGAQACGLSPQTQRRIRASYRVRAAAAALCVGGATYALGAGAAMTICLNAAWLAALSALPASALAAVFARHMLLREKRSRPLCAALAAVLLACAAFAALALISLVKETLLPLSLVSFIVQTTVVFLLLCLPSGAQGGMRAAFALRFWLPAGLFLLAARPISQSSVTGLFPLLGAGAKQTALCALMMTLGGLPALLLCLPPPELSELTPQQYKATVPGAGFFVWRICLGAAMGVVLLAALSLCGTYESIAGQRAWGQRMIILGSGAAREGVTQTLLMLLQALALALCAVNAALGAVQAVRELLRRRTSHKEGTP